MASIFFAGTYPPIMCGIATYTSYLTRESQVGKWGVLSFNLKKYGACQPDRNVMEFPNVWYGIPGREEFSASVIQQGLTQLGAGSDAILWFQHETAIWANPQRFISMLKELSIPKIVSFHTLHFQSDETPFGLRKYQYNILKDILPHVDAITVFSYGVFRAVTSAFPEHYDKIYTIKHGVHSYPRLSSMSRSEAKEKLFDFLMYESDLDTNTKSDLFKKRIFDDPESVVIGQTGFLCPAKFSESLFLLRDNLQKITPDRRIIAVRIGGPRKDSHREYARRIRSELHHDSFLLEVWLPQEILPLAQRAFDINFYWPSQCTQSGVIAHALGTGAIIAGRDIEGLGETLKESDELVDTNMESLTRKIRQTILHPEKTDEIEKTALKYAQKYTWEKQIKQHYELADYALHSMPLWGRKYVLTGNSKTNVFTSQKTSSHGNFVNVN